MKLPLQYFFISVFTILSSSLFSQNHQLVDNIVDNYPKVGLNLDDVVLAIKNDFTTEVERTRAVFRWVATQISFDTELGKTMDYKSLKAFSYTTEAEKILKEKKFKEDLVFQTFTTRKTVCHGYAVLVEYMCHKLNIEAVVITGVLKSDPSEIGQMPVLNHAWNAVKINGEWKFLDVTLAAGFISSNTDTFKFDYTDGYFFTDPELFFLNHFPLNEKWLLISKSKKDFTHLPCYLRNYIKFDYQIVGPESGIYSKKNGSFTFNVKGIDQYDSVQYSLNSRDNQKILLEQDYTKEYMIDLAAISNDFLTIYINDRPMIVYKIID